ncbi:hypothetical protein QVN42_10525 [Yersinia nurmii]|uniref:Uncharacterized protein n=1 Tax=Yersinia nurmii TaxID=685706 RepID=A0AAW7JYE1_9GAMM|nr:hypothetical protein [Yersinia nurmii]MDN0087823.1 hypothetical protein [Yersinia nurmii]CNE01336.1 Uncharacterised protein [Yersinia nurmii]
MIKRIFRLRVKVISIYFSRKYLMSRDHWGVTALTLPINAIRRAEKRDSDPQSVVAAAAYQLCYADLTL